jgi:WD40 repeat protein
MSGPAAGRDEDRAREVLAAYGGALRREAHVLAERPELTFQQLYNRLQWGEGPALEFATAEAKRRASDPEGSIWFQSRTPLLESETLIGTLVHAGVQGCAVSPDGGLLSSFGSGGSLRLWDTASGAEIGRSDDPARQLVSCAFDRGGRFLVAGGDDGRVWIRDAATSAELAELAVEGGAPAHCATSPFEPVAAIASGAELRVVELPSGRVRRSSSVEDGSFSCCAFSQLNLIATGDDRGTLRLFDTETLDESLRWSTGLPGGIETCDASPNGAFVALTPGGGNQEVLLVGGPDENGRPQTVRRSYVDVVNDCRVSPDGRWLAAVGDDRLVWLWELTDPKGPMSVLEGHDAPVTRCAFAANGSLFATAARDGMVKLWNPWLTPSHGGIGGHRERVTALAFAPDGSTLVSASADLTLKTWEPAPTVERNTLEGHTAPVWDCIVMKGGVLVASAAGDGTVRIWDAATPRQTRELRFGPTTDVRSLAYSPDGYLLAVGHDRSVSLWELATDERLSEAEVAAAGAGAPGPEVQDCAFTDDGRGLLVACEDGTLRLWEVEGWTEAKVLRGHAGLVSCCATVPGSSLAVSGGADGTLRLWELGSGAELHTFRGHGSQIGDCAVSHDATFAISAGWDRTLRLWDLGERVPLAAFSTPVQLRSVAPHPSMYRVALGDTHGQVRVVDVLGLPFGSTAAEAQRA